MIVSCCPFCRRPLFFPRRAVTFETLEALLDHTSPAYRMRFGELLAAKLVVLQNPG